MTFGYLLGKFNLLFLGTAQNMSDESQKQLAKVLQSFLMQTVSSLKQLQGAAAFKKVWASLQ